MTGERSGCFDLALKVIAFVMALGLFLALPLALAGRSFGRVFFRPAVLATVVRDSVLESGVIQTVIREDLFSREWFNSSQEQGDDIGRYFEYLSPGEREEIFQALLPPNWIENQFTGVLGGLYSWLEDDRLTPALALDLQPLKTNLLRGGIATFVETVVDSWPSCKPEQVETMQQEFFERGQLPQALCEPPEPLRARVVDLVAIGFEEQVRQIPDTLSLLETNASGQDFSAMKEPLLFFRALMLWGWMLPISLLGLIMALAIRSWSDFGRWWGLPLLWGGVGTFLLAIFFSAIREDLISEWLRSAAFVGAIQNGFSAGYNGIYTAGLRPLWFQSFVVFGFGLMLWGTGRKAARKRALTPVVGSREPEAIETRILPTGVLNSEIEEDGEPPAGIFG